MAEYDADKTTTEQWKEKCRAGDEIPHQAIIEHKLMDWFLFTPIEGKLDVSLCLAEATGEVVTEWEYIDPATGERDGHLYRREPSGEYVRITRREPDGEVVRISSRDPDYNMVRING